MKQTDSLKRLEMPNINEDNEYVCYEMRMQPCIKFETEELKSLYQRHEMELLAMAEKEAWDYLVDVEAWDISPGESFPCGEELTGEWYIGEVSLKEGKQIHGQIYMRFLGYYQPPTVRPPVDDYLGMEFMFYYNSETDTFEFDGFNTDSI